MNSIWKNLYDHFKDRRYGGIFILAMLACTGLSVFTWKVLEAARQGTLVYWLPGVALFAGAYAWSITRRVRRQRSEPWKNQPLSGDELRKARARLMTPCRTFKKN
jgi:hypothetical protein